MGFGFVIGFIDHLQIATTSNYNALANSCPRHLTTAHTKSSQIVYTSLFLVMDPNNILCLCPYWLTNIPQLTHCSNCLLSTSCPGYNISARTASKMSHFVVVVQSFPWEQGCLRSRYSATPHVYLLISRSLPSSRSTCCNIIFPATDSEPERVKYSNLQFYLKLGQGRLLPLFVF
jgi:hypothetical protein